MSRRGIFALSVLVALVVACRPGEERGTVGSPDVSAPGLVADADTYVLRPDGPGWTTRIGFEARAGDDTVYVVNCNGAILMNLQKRQAGAWVDAWYAEGDQCLSDPIVIPPGETLEGEVTIWGAPSGESGFNTFRADNIEGEYRLLWPQPVLHYRREGPAFGDTLPIADRVSASFTLTTDPSGSTGGTAHEFAYLESDVERLIAFLKGNGPFPEESVADSVTLYVAPDGQAGQAVLSRDELADRGAWRVGQYAFVPPVAYDRATITPGLHGACQPVLLETIFPELARFPHVGVKLAPEDPSSCLQSWTVTFVFDGAGDESRLVAVVYDQWEW